MLTNKQTRFSIEWTPALAAFVALGFSRIEAHLPSRTKIVAWLLVGLWLTATFYPAVTSSISDTKNQVAQYGSVDEFRALSAWITTNTSATVRGATDIPTALAYSTDRDYYGMGYIIGAAQERGITVDEFLSQINVTLIIVGSGTAQSLGFPQDPNLKLLKQFPDFDIYTYHCLNCTQSP